MTVAALALLSFGTSQAAAAMITAVTPDSDLPEGPTTVKVSGTGWQPGTVLLQQCTDVAVDDLRCRPPGFTSSANGSGNFGPTDVTVSRTFVDGGTHDCRVETCFIWVGDLGGNEARHNITFAPPSTGGGTATPALPALVAPLTTTPPKKCKKGRKLRRGKCVRRKK